MLHKNIQRVWYNQVRLTTSYIICVTNWYFKKEFEEFYVRPQYFGARDVCVWTFTAEGLYNIYLKISVEKAFVISFHLLDKY